MYPFPVFERDAWDCNDNNAIPPLFWQKEVRNLTELRKTFDKHFKREGDLHQ